MNNIETLHPVSPVQEAMLRRAHDEHRSGVDSEQLNCALEGLSDIPAFERAWHEIAERYGVLRSFFAGKRGFDRGD